MDEREKKARYLCKHKGIDPDATGTGIGKTMEKGRKYPLWVWQAENVIDVLDEYEQEQEK